MHRCCVVIAALCAASSLALADWPEFRGPTGQGIAETAQGLPVAWSETENVAWKVPVPGLGWSSPVVVDGRIYLTTAVQTAPQVQSLRVLCGSAATGQGFWEREVFVQRGQVEFHEKNSHASPTVLVHDGRVYAHFGPHGTACLNTDGNVIWRRTLAYKPVYGNGGSPALAGDTLIICCDGSDVQYVVGLDARTGQPRWRTDRNVPHEQGLSFSTPLVIDVNGQPQAVCPGAGGVVAYDPATGRELWRVLYPNGIGVVPRPVYAHGLVYVCTGYYTPHLLAIDPTGRGDVTHTHVRFRLQSNIPNNPSPLVVGNELYIVSDAGIATCVDARTGQQHWQRRLGGDFSASPLYADGRIYFQNENGQATVIAPGTQYRALQQNTFAPGARTFASYAVDGRALLIRSETHLYRIEERPAR